MIRNIFIFLGTFAAGALIALVARAALFEPHVDHTGSPAGGGDYAPMVSNPLANGAAPEPASKAAVPSAQSAPADPHAQHNAASTKPSTAKTPVNTVCAICGMDVDPNLPTVEYEGQTIGFGCKLCPPKFKADPERYGPLYLKNETVKR